MTIYHLIVLGSVFVAAVAQMFLKKGASVPHPSFIREYLNVWVVGGYALMLASLLIDIWAIGRGVQVKEVSTMESCSYLFVTLLGAWLFKEKITLRKSAAILMILAGVIIFFQ